MKACTHFVFLVARHTRNFIATCCTYSFIRSLTWYIEEPKALVDQDINLETDNVQERANKQDSLIERHNILTTYCFFLVAKRHQTTKNVWTDRQKAAVQVSLAKYFFIKGQLPGKREIENCIVAHECLSTRSWRNIKDFIRNYQTRNL
jgi:hypothetical protein